MTQSLDLLRPFDLKTALLLTGVLLICGHGAALLWPARVREFLRTFPRSKALGLVLLVVAALWSWLLVRTIDLGEFTNWKPRILLIIPIAAFLTWQYVDEFLAVRALGMLVLLGAEPLLEAAFLRPELSRLFLVSLVYLWITLALFWIGMPYTLRDQIGWVTRTEGRWKAAAVAGVAYGVVLLTSLLTLHR